MVEGIAIGPTWKRGADGEIVLPPVNSLGWEAIAWAEKWLLQPDGPDAGKPWRFTNEQRRFLCWFYELDSNGLFKYRTATYRRSKGTGKNPLAAAIALIELVGPCRYSGKRYSDGRPIAQPHYASWVQSAAVARDQTKNLMTLLPAMVSPDMRADYGMEIGKEVVYGNQGRCRLEAVTSSPSTIEGGRATFVVMDETHLWKANNDGHAMSEVIRRNAGKSRDGSARALAITNAHTPGQDSVAEQDYEAWRQVEQGLSESTDILYDSLEAPETDLKDDQSIMDGILAARGNSDWLSPERILAEIRDPRTTPAMARRFYLNQIVAEEDKPFNAAKWASLIRTDYLPSPGEMVTLGFDGSLSRDHTALIGTEIKTGHQWVVGYWEPQVMSNGDLRIPFLEVDQTVDAAFERWDVWRLNADPYKWGQLIDAWSGRHGEDRIVRWNTTQYRRMGVALQDYAVAINTAGLTHDGDRRFSAAIANSHKHMLTMRDDDGDLLWVIQKERPDSPLKIDAAVAACLSWEAYNAAIASGILQVEEAGAFFV